MNKTAMVNAQNFFFFIYFFQKLFFMVSTPYTLQIQIINTVHYNRILYIQSNGGRAEWGEPNVEKVILP
ncbi:hypothetical protein, partial [Thiolapillus sp.]|uniref:hypothetical protein n=1 Tax=Thiolapillus sp. TaxID=2017437 RepID=UPI003AF6072A